MVKKAVKNTPAIPEITKSLKEKLMAAVNNVFIDNESELTGKIQKVVNKFVKKIVKKTNKQIKKTLKNK